MKIFIYEFVTGGGFLGDDEMPPKSLLKEGAAMLAALAEDFARLPDTSVCTLRDQRISIPELGCPTRPLAATKVAFRSAKERTFPERKATKCAQENNKSTTSSTTHEVSSREAEEELFFELAQQSDWTVVIAPEFDALLEQRARWVLDAGGRLLGPAPDTIALAANKHRLATHLAEAGVLVSDGQLIQRGERIPADFGFPAVLKPNDGAGSLGVQLIQSADEARAMGALTFTARIEKLIAGAACSTAVLCGPKANHPLVPCRQKLSDDGCFHYLGGSLPLPHLLVERAQRLALAAVATLPSPLGYIGVDLVLGESASQDAVIEINPRLTTSYVGLRAACRQNLAAAMLDVARGGEMDLQFEPRHLEFSASGRVFGH